MEDLVGRAGPYAPLIAFSLVGFALVAWRWWRPSGGLSLWAAGSLALLTVALFLLLLVSFRNANPQLGFAEHVGFAVWGSVFLVGSGTVIWLMYQGRKRM
jgi:hypothetical protein